MKVQEDPRDGLMGDSRASQILRIVTLVLVLGVFFAVWVLSGSVNDLDQDDKLINRDQEATICVGDLSDDKFDWLFIALGEVFAQIRALDEGNPLDLTAGEEAVANGRKVAELQEEARGIHAALLARDDPDEGFVCPEPDPALDPDNVPIDP